MKHRIALVAVLLPVGCVPPSQNTPNPLPKPQYSYTPTPPCATPGAAKLTLAVVEPTWQDPSTPSGMVVQAGYVGQPRAAAVPRAVLELRNAMKADFLQLVTCRGYLARGPFDSFESMVFPDRQASQLLLEPDLQISVDITGVEQETPDFVTAVLNKMAPTKIAATATVGGRVNLNLKEPVTNTRMWSRSIEVPQETFSFVTDAMYSPAGGNAAVLRYEVLSDDGLIRALTPHLESMYKSVFTTAESYLNRDELQSVAAQAVDVRKKAAIGVPPTQ